MKAVITGLGLYFKWKCFLEAWGRGVGFSLDMLFPLSHAMTKQEIKNGSKDKFWEGI